MKPQKIQIDIKFPIFLIFQLPQTYQVSFSNKKFLNDEVLLTCQPISISVEKNWVHAADGSNIELVCILHGDVNSDVSIVAMKQAGD